MELLSPAGNLEKLRAAINFGADAVYLSGPGFGLRAASTEFSPADLATAVVFAHGKGVKVYVTVNATPHENEYPALKGYLDLLARVKPDGLIVSDPGVILLCRERLPGVPIHLSTQANAVSSAACRAWYGLGVRRIVLARELSLSEIREIRKNIPADLALEAFVHGSMCISYSGRCLLSSYFTGRDANRGDCTQPCRWKYRVGRLAGELIEESRPDEPIPVEEDAGGTFILASRDLSMIEHLSDLAEAGISSLKIEGRMKSACYVAAVTNAYRMALDALARGEKTVDPRLLAELESVSHREYSTGFYYGNPHDDPNVVSRPGYLGEKSYLAAVIGYDGATGRALCEQRNKCAVGDEVEILSPGQFGRAFSVASLLDEDGAPIECTPHPGMRFRLPVPFPVSAGDLLRCHARSGEIV